MWELQVNLSFRMWFSYGFSSIPRRLTSETTFKTLVMWASSKQNIRFPGPLL